MIHKLQTDTSGETDCSVHLGDQRPVKRPFDLSCSHGFTLVELIVITAIIGVLAMMAIPFYNSYLTLTKNAACIADIRTIEKAISAYNAEKGDLPPSATALSDVGYATLVDPWKQPFVYTNLSEALAVPLEDFLGEPLNYDFDLYSKGANGDSSANYDAAKDADDIVRLNDGSFVGLRP